MRKLAIILILISTATAQARQPRFSQPAPQPQRAAQAQPKLQARASIGPQEAFFQVLDSTAHVRTGYSLDHTTPDNASGHGTAVLGLSGFNSTDTCLMAGAFNFGGSAPSATPFYQGIEGCTWTTTQTKSQYAAIAARTVGIVITCSDGPIDTTTHGAAQTANNLSDLASSSTARTNLGLGTAATQASSAFLQPANNLSDVSAASTARTNLGLGTIATKAATSGSGIQKGDGSGGLTAATSGTDYAPATSGSSILKGNGSGGFSSATSGTDFAPATSGMAILKGSGSGGFSSATAGSDYVAPNTIYIYGSSGTQKSYSSLAAAESDFGAGLHMVIGPGTYTITTSLTIYDNSTIEGVGDPHIKISSSVTGALNVVTNANTTSGNTNFKIRGLHIDGSDAEAGATDRQQGIALVLCSNFIVENNVIEHLGNSSVSSCEAINPSGCDDGIIRNNIITDTVDGINTDSNNGSSTSCTRLNVSGNVINSTNRDYGINLANCNNSTITHNVIRSNKSNIHLIGTSSNNIISSNNCQSSATEDGIFLTGSTASNLIIGNTVRGSNTYGIQNSGGTFNSVIFNDLNGAGTSADLNVTATSPVTFGNVTTSTNPSVGSGLIALIQGTLNVASGKTATINNTLTFTGTDGSTVNVGAGGTLAASAYTDTTNASNISSGTLGAARLPNPSASTLGGVKSLASVSHQFLTQIGTDGSVSQAQPASSDVSGLGTAATVNTGTSGATIPECNTANDFSAATQTFGNTGLKIKDVGGSGGITIKPNFTDATARTLNVLMNSGNRTLSLTSGSTAVINQDVSTTGTPTHAGLILTPTSDATITGSVGSDGQLMMDTDLQSPAFSFASTWYYIPAMSGSEGSGVATALSHATNGSGGLVTTDGTATLTNKSLSIGQVTGLGSGISTFLGTPSGSNLASALTSPLPTSKGGTGATSLDPLSEATSGTTSWTPNTDTCKWHKDTAVASALTINNPTATSPADGRDMWLLYKDNGSAESVSHDTNYVSSGIATMLTTTVAGKYMTEHFIYNSTLGKWVCYAADPFGY